MIGYRQAHPSTCCRSSTAARRSGWPSRTCQKRRQAAGGQARGEDLSRLCPRHARGLEGPLRAPGRRRRAHGVRPPPRISAVVDRDGNMVTLTQTLLSLFGARIVLPGTGILMNNGMNWFDPVPGGPELHRAGPPRPRQLRAGHHDRGAAPRRPSAAAAAGASCPPCSSCSPCRPISASTSSRHSTPRASTCRAWRWWWPTGACRRRRIDALAAEFATVVAEPVEYPFPFTIAGAVRRVGRDERRRDRAAAPLVRGRQRGRRLAPVGRHTPISLLGFGIRIC